MSSKVILVKNMVCHRCVLAVEVILKSSDIPYQKVLFGEIHLKEELSDKQYKLLQEKLSSIGFEMIDNRMSGLVEQIKRYTIRKARNEVDEKESRVKLSNYLSAKLNHEYTYLSSLFSGVEGRTIEKAKELIVYGQHTLSEIAYALDYSSVAHLSGQFKKVTGLTPSYYKEVGAGKRKSLDKI